MVKGYTILESLGHALLNCQGGHWALIFLESALKKVKMTPDSEFGLKIDILIMTNINGWMQRKKIDPLPFLLK